MSDEPRTHPSTLAAQALGWVESATRALVPPIHPSVPYERAADGSYPGGHTYTRDQNPTYDQAEALLSRLEGGQEALLFSSGMAAATTVFETLEGGAHVVAPEDMYFTLKRWLESQASSPVRRFCASTVLIARAGRAPRLRSWRGLGRSAGTTGMKT